MGRMSFISFSSVGSHVVGAGCDTSINGRSVATASALYPALCLLLIFLLLLNRARHPVARYYPPLAWHNAMKAVLRFPANRLAVVRISSARKALIVSKSHGAEEESRDPRLLFELLHRGKEAHPVQRDTRE